MCGEIEKYQTARQVTIRLETSASNQSIKLPFQFLRVEEIRLDEVMFTNFNGGASGVTYLDLKINNCSSAAINSDNSTGTALGVDVLNPRTVYQRPRVLQTAHGVTINDFQVRLAQSDGTLTTFNQCLLVLTFVMRKSAAEMEQYRAEQASLQIPQMKGVDPRSTYQGQEMPK